MGNYKDGSDIDLCLKGSKIDFNICAKIKSMLEDEGPLPYTVDVVSYNEIENKSLKDHINKNGISLFKTFPKN